MNSLREGNWAAGPVNVEQSIDGEDHDGSGDEGCLRDIQVNDLIDVMRDEGLLVITPASASAEVLLDQGQRAIPVENLNRDSIAHRADVDVLPGAPAAAQERAKDHKRQEGQMDQRG